MEVLRHTTEVGSWKRIRYENEASFVRGLCNRQGTVHIYTVRILNNYIMPRTPGSLYYRLPNARI